MAKKTTKPYVPTAAEAAAAKKQGFRMAAGASAADYAYAASHKIDIRKSAASQNWGADNKVSPAVPVAPVIPVQTSLQGINQMPGASLSSQLASLAAGQNRSIAGGPAPVQTSLRSINQMPSTVQTSLQSVNAMPAYNSAFSGVTGSASVTPAKSNLPTGFGGISAISAPRPSAPGLAGATGTASVTPAPGSQPGSFTGAEPKAAQFYQPPSTAGTQPGAFTGSEPKAEQFYQPPSALPPGWNGVPKSITMADYNAYLRYMDVFNSGSLMGQVTPNMIAVSQGQLSDQNLASMGYQQGADGSWYLVGGGGSGAGTGGEGGGGGGGGGGYSPSRSTYGYGASDLLNWRIGT